MSLIGQSITVLGAGIGGLCLARALALRGAQVHVLEQAPEITEVGAGLQVSANGARVLAALGLGEALAKASMQSQAVVLRDYARGDQVLRMDLSGRGTFALIHRADLIALLAEAAREAGVTIATGQKVTEVDLSAERPVLRLADGTSQSAEILVGADGLHSRVRAAILGELAPAFTGQAAWRALVSLDERAEASARPPAEAQVFMGKGRHLVAYPLRGGRVLNLVGVQEQEDWVGDSWSQTGDPDAFRAEFKAFGGPVPGWLARVETVGRWGLFRHPVAPRWHQGRAVLLGDAAHPTLPFLAQGACMALEDAWVLAEALATHDDVAAGFAAYAVRRAPRVERIVEAATANARNYHLRSGPVRFAAHAALRVMGRVAPDFMPGRFDWLYGEDVTAPG